MCAKIKSSKKSNKKKSFSRSEKNRIIFFKTKLHEKIIVMKKKLTCEFSLNNQIQIPAQIQIQNLDPKSSRFQTGI